MGMLLKTALGVIRLSTVIAYTNKLINEISPYLLQHAHNPVDWYPWGNEAFERAEREDKPVFLSVGYSTCHWCHVMAHECFEDQEVAEALNRDFVCIKVDREERPDVDAYAMDACQAMTGSGGWPLSVFMDRKKNIFFAGTYFPKRDAMGIPGFLTILERIRVLWRSDRDDLLQQSEELQKSLRAEEAKAAPVDFNVPEQVFRSLERAFDPEFGGFSGAPKFPSPQNLLFLLRYHAATGDKKALALCEKTLKAMRRGGMYDQLGFGFCRYSTDRRWLIPHFEKMLEDNALLCIAYTEAFQCTGEPLFEQTVRELFTFLTGTFQRTEGGFFSALDADSEGEEGRYYAFSPEEVRAALGENAEEFCGWFGIREPGNFKGKSIPNLIGSEIPEGRRKDADRLRAELLRYRSRRVPPSLDDKLVTARNGLAIAALAFAGRVLADAEMMSAARRAADFFLCGMTGEDGRLRRAFRERPSEVPGFAEDYSFLIWGLIELYQNSLMPEYLDAALRLNGVFREDFYDEERGGYFSASRKGERMPVFRKEISDSSAPSANAVQVWNLIRLARLSGEPELEEQAVRTLENFLPEISRFPAACPTAASAVLYLRDGGTDVSLTRGCPDTLRPMLDVLRSDYRPFLTLRRNGTETAVTEAAVCTRRVCFPSALSPEQLLSTLEESAPDKSKKEK